MRRPVVWMLAGLVAAGLALVLVLEPWRAVTSSDTDETEPGGEDLFVVDDNPAPRSAEAEELEAALRGERTFLRGLKEAARAENAERARDEQRREDQEERRLQEDQQVGGTVELAAGELEAAEHPTTGRARVLDLADGRRVVRLVGLDTTEGPDLRVWVTDQPSGGAWGSYDDGRVVGLGGLEAVDGTSSYEVPAGADLRGMRSVVIWCDRVDVAFGTAPVSL